MVVLSALHECSGRFRLKTTHRSLQPRPRKIQSGTAGDAWQRICVCEVLSRSHFLVDRSSRRCDRLIRRGVDVAGWPSEPLIQKTGLACSPRSGYDARSDGTTH